MRMYIYRIFALIITAAIIAVCFPISVSAEEYYQSDINIRVGLIFGTGSVDSFPTTSENGFVIGLTKKMTGDSLKAFFTVPHKKISVARDTNLSKNSVGRYYANDKNIVIGKYNAQFSGTFKSFAEAISFISALPPKLSDISFPVYNDGPIVVRCGNFPSKSAAEEFIAGVSGYKFSVAAPADGAVTVINTENDSIIFEFDAASNNLSIAGMKKDTPYPEGTFYNELSQKFTDLVRSPAGNTYYGTFVYRVNTYGLEVIDIIHIDDYIKGVLPYEIYPDWPDEALKAFSIVVRTFTYYSLGRHTSAGYSMCNGTHCQMFVGMKNATEKSNAAVETTKDIIATYNGRLIEALYSSSMGGVSENNNDAWGSSAVPYLKSTEMPFENYTDPSHKNALWKNVVSPKTLYEYLITASSSAPNFKDVLKSPVKEINITGRSVPSNYVKQVEFVDTAGNKVKIKNSDSVRIALMRYVNSANMDIYTRFDYPLNNAGVTALETNRLYAITSKGTKSTDLNAGKITILTAAGTKSPGIDDYSFVFDGKGWGHGVGLSQYGTYDLALLGYKYEDIVKTFYSGIELKKITEVKK